MPTIQLNRDEINAGKLIEPKWYRAVVDGVETQAAKTDGSTNFIISFRIPSLKDFKVRDSANEKYKARLVPILQCFAGEIKEDVQYDLNSLIGKEVDIFVENAPDNKGTIRNQIKQYRPVT